MSNTDEVLLHTKLCKMMAYSIDNHVCNDESSLSTLLIHGSTNFAEEQPDISEMLTMSSIDIDTDVMDIANNPYMLNNVRICICDQKYSSHQICKACAQVHGLFDYNRTVQCNGCASFFHLKLYWMDGISWRGCHYVKVE
eukprot:8257980-Ditylum_brightwellii.AAC.1